MRGPGDEAGRGRRSESLMVFVHGVCVSESELLADTSEAFGVESRDDCEDRFMWSSIGTSRVSREEDR